MKTILTVNHKELQQIENAYTQIYSPEICKRPVAWPSPLSVRHIVPGMPITTYTFIPNFGKDYVDVEYNVEGYAIMNAPSDIYSNFTFRFKGASDMVRGKNSILIRPKDPIIASRMLQKYPSFENGNNYEFIQMIYFMCSTAIAYFPIGFNTKTKNEEVSYLTVKQDFLDVIKTEENRIRVEHMYDGWDYVSVNYSDMNDRASCFIATVCQSGRWPA